MRDRDDRGPAASDGAGQVGGPETNDTATTAAVLGATLRRVGQRIDSAGRALLTGDLHVADAVELAAGAVRDLIVALGRAVER